MNSLLAILLKNTVLFVLIGISLVFIFTTHIDFKEVRFIFLGMGILYICISCYEALKLSQIQPDVKKFIYFTDGFLAKRFIKIIAFACCGFVLYFSGSIIKYLSFLCFLIAFTEIVVTFWRYTKKLCFIAFEANTLVISTNKLNTMLVSDIAKIEARHGLTYFVNLHQQSFTVRTDMMQEKEAFRAALNLWIKNNNLADKVVGSI